MMTSLLLIPVIDAMPALEAYLERWPDDGTLPSDEELREFRQASARFLPASRLLVRYAMAINGRPGLN
jgi:hypothetical protein